MWLSSASICDIGRQHIPLVPFLFLMRYLFSQNQSNTSVYRLFVFLGWTPWLFTSSPCMRYCRKRSKRFTCWVIKKNYIFSRTIEFLFCKTCNYVKLYIFKSNTIYKSHLKILFYPVHLVFRHRVSLIESNNIPVQDPDERLFGLEYFPEGHFSHVFDILLLWNVPFGQMLHGFSPVSEYSPLWQVSISKH